MISQNKEIKMVDLQTQYHHIKNEIDSGIAEVMESGTFVNGPPVKKFTKDLATYLDVAHVIPCGNGTDALQIALMALGLKPGDEVITVAFTFVATAEVIALLGLKPVFVDIDPETFNIDVNKIEEKITDRTKCIIPVHLFGQSSDMEPIMQIAEKHNLYVIEDNAQAISSEYTFSNGKTQKTGTIGHIGTTSFYPSKNLGCYGDGGALFTNDEALCEQIRVIANHGQKIKYHYSDIGVNSRLDSFQAVVLNAKLPHLDNYVEKRQAVAAYYDKAFGDHPNLRIPIRAQNSTHVFHQYTLLVKNDRDGLKAALKEKGIPTMVYYPYPLHLEPAYLEYGYKSGDLPVTEKHANSVISLPMHTELDEVQLEEIVGSIISKTTPIL